ncbi:hypothetical protein CASFOL_027792 [Castilleja foliolosa]|uniref:RNase H type-1 domain-containing protein n=1 Tax=Castilleja foliolosa TaxID=1961234 RepID=A0ABD3CFV4_9LAMI
MDDLKVAGSSRIWTDICFCRDIIREGAIYKVNAKSNILIWNEPWVPTIPGFIPQSISTLTTPPPYLQSDMINFRSLSWKFDTLYSIFNAKTVTEIFKIQISSEDRHKTLVWSPSKSGLFSIKSAYLISNGNAHSGIIIRNEDGSITNAASYQHACLDSEAAECLAILDSCLMAQNLNISKAIFESENLNAITSICGASLNVYWPSSPLIDQIKRLWKGWPHWVFKFTPRSCNGVAHNLAKWASLCIFDGLVHVDSLPTNVFCDQGFPLVNFSN